MKRRVGNAFLFNRYTGSSEPASIFHGLDEKNFADFEAAWKPALDGRAAEFEAWEEKAEANVQDAHWDWVKKAKAEGQFDTYAVECGDMTQALMLIDCRPRRARLRTQYNELCYVELIASAPWNRIKFSDKPKYKGAGRTLIATAISLSVELELQGRLGLHSLAESLNWYPFLGFTDCGYDENKKLQYFEMTEESAKAFFQQEDT
jgi:hypothetical protein